MNQLNLKMTGAWNVKPVILIDDKPVKWKKNKYGNVEIIQQFDKDKVEVKICKYFELNGKLWFLMSMLFFIISLFGILDVPYNKKCIAVDCKFIVALAEKTEVKVKFNKLSDQGRAVEIESEAEVQEIINEYYVDTRAKKRRKILIITKLLVWIALIISIICFLIFR